MARRLSRYTPELATAICENIAGGKSLRKICRAPGMPAASTVCLWLTQEAAFAEQYAHARDARGDALFEEILEIADDRSKDFKTIIRDGQEVQVFDHEHVQRARLRVDSRKWFLSKLNPKKYGDKLELAGDPDNPPHRYVVHVPEVQPDGDKWLAGCAPLFKNDSGQTH